MYNIVFLCIFLQSVELLCLWREKRRGHEGDGEEEIMVALFNGTPLTDSLCCYFPPPNTHRSDLKIPGLKAQMFSLTHKRGIVPARGTAGKFLLSSKELIWDERS